MSRKLPDKIYGWVEDKEGKVICFGSIPPHGVHVVEYTINNEGRAKITVTLGES